MPKRLPLLAKGRLPDDYREEPVSTSRLRNRDSVEDRSFWTQDMASYELGIPLHRVKRWCARHGLVPAQVRNGRALYRPSELVGCVLAGSAGYKTGYGIRYP